MRLSDFSYSIYGYVLRQSNSIAQIYDHPVYRSTHNTVHTRCSNEPPMKKRKLKETITLRKTNKINIIEIIINSLSRNSFPPDESYASDSNIESKRAAGCDEKVFLENHICPLTKMLSSLST